MVPAEATRVVGGHQSLIVVRSQLGGEAESGGSSRPHATAGMVEGGVHTRQRSLTHASLCDNKATVKFLGRNNYNRTRAPKVLLALLVTATIGLATISSDLAIVAMQGGLRPQGMDIHRRAIIRSNRAGWSHGARKRVFPPPTWAVYRDGLIFSSSPLALTADIVRLGKTVG
jgi:hypothetical protein